MGVHGLALDVGEESSPIEVHCAALRSRSRAVGEDLMVNVFDRFLRCDDMPLACDLFLNSALSSHIEGLAK